MIINHETAKYILAVIQRLTDGTINPAVKLTNECPECSDYLGFFNTDGHVVYDASTDTDPEHMIVIVACEGYWVINPNLVGIPSRDWQAAS